MMPDREKVISGLQRCRLMNKINCDKCPYDYNGRGNGKSECTAELADDALALLKEQEAVVRCKDCNHYRAENGECLRHHFIIYFSNGNWFCADGERQEGR